MKSKRLSKGVVLIELSERLIKVVQMRPSGPQKKIVSLAAVETAFQNEEELSQKLSALLKQLPLRPYPIFASLSRSQVTTRALLLPSVQPSELFKMISFQVEKLIPFPKEKIVFDYHLLETTPEGYSRILLVMAEEEMIRRHLSVLKGAGCVPDSLFFTSDGLRVWSEKEDAKEEKNFIAFLDVDLFSTQVEVLQKGKLYFTRSFSIGSRRISESEEAGPAFGQEVNRTVVAFKKEFPDKKIGRLLLNSAAESLPTVEKWVAVPMELSIESVDIASLCPIEESALSEGLARKVSFASAVGLLLDKEKKIDLIPFQDKKERLKRASRSVVLQFLVLSVLLVFAIGLSVGKMLQRQSQFLQALKGELRGIEPAAVETEKMNQQLEVLKGRSAQSEDILEELRELYRVIPPETSLTYLSIELDRLSLRGGSKDLATVSTFAKSLEASPLFVSVQVKNATRRLLPEGEITDFRIDAKKELKEKRKK